MSLQIGDRAPDFTLIDTDKQQVSLSAQKGKNVLLLFFPLAFTSVCTKELCGVRDNISFFDKVEATVFGISVDSPQSLGRFKMEQGLNFTLLSDFNKEACTAFDAIYETFAYGMKGVAKRSAFVIDNEGNVQYAEVLESAGDVPNFEAIEEVLSKLA